jgi:predicted CXXCH cytochrome family protein
MRTTKSLLLTLTLALFTAYSFSQTMVGTAHDFGATATWAGFGTTGGTLDGGRTCVVCHIAHNSANVADYAPLWNRNDPTALSAAIFVPYQSLTFEADDAASGTAGVAGATGADPWVASTDYVSAAYADYLTETAGLWVPDGTSVLCLSCHDGVGNLDAFGGTTNGTAVYAVQTGTVVMTRAEALRNNGNGEHPYSFTYDPLLVTQDGGLVAATDAGVLELLSEGKVQCTSCHDVHNSAGSPYALLVKDNAQSALCRTCHTK